MVDVFGLLGFLAISATIFLTVEIPTSVWIAIAWLALVLLSISLREPKKWAKGILFHWSPVFITLFAYDSIHKELGGYLPAPHTFPQMNADKWLFGGHIPTVWLQDHLYTPLHPKIWDFLTLLVYNTHFVVTICIGMVLWKKGSRHFKQYMILFVGLTTMGYATYAIFPAVPPWLASQHGDLAQTHRVVRDMWTYFGQDSIAQIFSGSSVYANDVAAIPSLHAAYPLSLLLFFWGVASRPLRALMVIYPTAMAFTLTYTAEHYFFDILLGWVYAVIWVLVLTFAAHKVRLRRASVSVHTAPSFAQQTSGTSQ